MAVGCLARQLPFVPQSAETKRRLAAESYEFNLKDKVRRPNNVSHLFSHETSLLFRGHPKPAVGLW